MTKYAEAWNRAHKERIECLAANQMREWRDINPTWADNLRGHGLQKAYPVGKSLSKPSLGNDVLAPPKPPPCVKMLKKDTEKQVSVQQTSTAPLQVQQAELAKRQKSGLFKWLIILGVPALYFWRKK